MNTNTVRSLENMTMEGISAYATSEEVVSRLNVAASYVEPIQHGLVGQWRSYEDRIEELQKQLDDFKMKLQMLMDMLPDDDIDVGELL